MPTNAITQLATPAAAPKGVRVLELGLLLLVLVLLITSSIPGVA